MIHYIILYTVLIVVILLISALFSAAETAMIGIPLPKLHKLKSDGNKNAFIISELREEKEMLLSSLLIASTVLETVASSVAITLTVHVGGLIWVPFTTAVITILVVLFGEIIPKTYAFEYPTKVALKIAPLIKFSVKILFPITKVVQWSVRLFFKMFRIRLQNQDISAGSTEMLRGAIEMGHSLGYLLKYDKEMLDGILDLSDYTVEEVMTHRRNLYSFDINTNIDTILRESLKSGHSRFPIWENDQENIIGIMHIKDLFSLVKFKENKRINKKEFRSILTEPWFVPGVTLLSEQLVEFRRRKIHFSIVVDEYGTMEGIISLEDILEEIVGNIDDEHDKRNVKMIQKNKDGSFIVKGSAPIRDLNRKLGWTLPDEEASTIAGFVIHESEIVPEIGDKFHFRGISFEVLGKVDNQITKLRIRR